MKRTLILLFLLLIFNTSFAADNISKFDLHAQIGYNFTKWDPGDTDSSYKSIDFKTEDLHIGTFDLGLAYKKRNIFSFNYKTTLLDRPTQNEMLKAQNESKENGLEEYLLGISPTAIGELMGIYDGNLNLSNWTLGTLLSFRYNHLVTKFYGTGTSRFNLTYKTLDGTTQNFGKNQTIGFETKFTENRYMVDLLSGRGENIALLLGYYDLKYKRPITNTYIGNGETIYEAEFKSKGILIGVSTKDRYKPGLGFDIIVKPSTKSTINTYDGEYKKDLVSGEMDLWYNHYFKKQIITIGTKLSTESWTEKDDLEAEIDADTRVSVYVKYGF